MSSEPIHIDDDSELPLIVEEAKKRPVRFERKGIVYLLLPEEPLPEWTDEGRDGVRDALQKSAGSWSEADAQALIAAIDRVNDLFSDEEVDNMVERLYEHRRSLTQDEDTVTEQDYDPEAYREALHNISGIVTRDEAAEMLERLYEHRRQDAESASSLS